MSTEVFPSNGCCTVACLHRCYLAVGLHVTICKPLCEIRGPNVFWSTTGHTYLPHPSSPASRLCAPMHLSASMSLLRQTCPYQDPQSSRDSDDCGSIPGRGKRFSVFLSVQADSTAHPASYPMSAGGSFPEIKGPGREADRSPTCSAVVKTGGATLPLPVCMA
jgi:hypothetical protein